MNFSLGEKALFAVATTTEGQGVVGEIVEIVEVGPWPNDPASGGREYGCQFSDVVAYVFGWQLRKLDPPPEPAGLVRSKSLTVIS